LLIFSTIAFMLLIPATFITTEINLTFWKLMTYFNVAFWLYVVGYMAYKILLKYDIFNKLK